MFTDALSPCVRHPLGTRTPCSPRRGAAPREHHLLDVTPLNSTYLACAMMVRGDVEVSDLTANVERCARRPQGGKGGADGDGPARTAAGCARGSAWRLGMKMGSSWAFVEPLQSARCAPPGGAGNRKASFPTTPSHGRVCDDPLTRWPSPPPPGPTSPTPRSAYPTTVQFRSGSGAPRCEAGAARLPIPPPRLWPDSPLPPACAGRFTASSASCTGTVPTSTTTPST